MLQLIWARGVLLDVPIFIYRFLPRSCSTTLTLIMVQLPSPRRLAFQGIYSSDRRHRILGDARHGISPSHVEITETFEASTDVCI